MYFFYFYLLIVHISLTLYIIYLKLLVHTTNIAIEETLSQIFYTGPFSFLIKCRNNVQKNNLKVTRFFLIK